MQREGKEMPWVTEHLLKQEFELANTGNNMGDNPTYGALRFRQLAGNLTVASGNSYDGAWVKSYCSQEA